MKSLALACALFAFAAHAEEVDVRATLHQALEAKAELPATPPSLPTEASEHAVDAHANIAFGQKGAAERAAHARAHDDAAAAAGRARAAAANHAAQEAAGEALKNPTAEVHSAAGQERAAQAHDTAHGHSPLRGNQHGP